jgi:type IV secretory pathway VirB10-like protein
VYLQATVVSAAVPADSRGGSKQVIAAAGAVIPAVLTTPIDLHGGATTVLAQVADDTAAVPKDTRFIGSASATNDGRISLRFHRLLLPDKREANCDAEAQDANGAFGLAGNIEGGSGRSFTKDLATDTATDVASETLNTLTGGLGGRLLHRAVGRASSGAYANRASTVRITLGAGAKFQIFLKEVAVLRD